MNDRHRHHRDIPWVVHVHGLDGHNPVMEEWLLLSRDAVHEHVPRLVHQMNCEKKGTWRRIVVYRQHRGQISTARRIYDYTPSGVQ
jgi:hypothetical protein